VTNSLETLFKQFCQILYIVSGDRDLLSLKRYRQTKIVSSSKLVRIIRHERPSA